MCRLPFADESADFITCLFDSVNFLLEPELVEQAMEEFARVLSPRGILYFDIVTERMVIEHFEGQQWTEENGSFTTTWEGTYDRTNGIADTAVRVNTGAVTHIRERVYPLKQVRAWMEQAGLEVLGVMDAETWKPVSRRTIRVDLVGARRVRGKRLKPFRHAVSDVRAALD